MSKSIIKQILVIVVVLLFARITQAQRACPDGTVASSHTYDCSSGLNSSAINHRFDWYLGLDTCCTIYSAVLTVNMSSNQESSSNNDDQGATNDLIALEIYDNGTSSYRVVVPNHEQWVYSTTGQPTTVHLNQPATKTWQLTSTEIQLLNLSHKLKVGIEDDTKVTSASLEVRECCPPNTSLCNTNFDVTATTTGMPPGFFKITASNYSGPSLSTQGTWDVAPGCSYWWEVKDLNTGAGSLGGGPGLYSWYGPTGFPTINFPGYVGTATASGSAPGKFVMGHCYRITRGTWNCSGWHTNSIKICMAQSVAKGQSSKPIITHDDSYKPTEAEVEKIIRTLTSTKK